MRGPRGSRMMVRERRPRSPLRPWVGVGLVVVAALAFVAAGRPGRLPEPVGPAGSAGAGASPGADPAATAAPPAGREVFGYVPYWEMDDGIGEHLAETELSTLALFSVTHTPQGELAVREPGYRRIEGVGRRLLEEARERGVRVELTWTSFGEARNRAFFEDPEAQARWIEVLTSHAVERGFDGLNVDVEGLPPELVPAYGSFLGRLREALVGRAPESRLSVATASHQLGAAMAAAAAGAGADRIFLMGYDYRTAGSEPGGTAPLDRTDGGVRDLVWSLDLYAAANVPPERTILGLPLYGVTWPVLGPEFGAAAVARGDPWVPRRNLDVFADPHFDPTLDETESVEFYAVGSGDAWHAVYYDSPRSLRPKLALATARGLAGAGFWAIGYERGLPGYTSLIRSFRGGDPALGSGD